MRRAHLADQQWQNLDKYHYDVTTSDKEPGDTTLRVVGSTGSHYPLDHALQKAEKRNEPMRHDSLALLAPKNRNNRNQELEKKSVKEKPRILFSKTLNSDARGHGTQDNPEKTGSYTYFLNPFNETTSNAWRNTQPC